MLDDHEFALCLTHDVDRVRKSYQVPAYTLRDRNLSHVRTALSEERPYWQFEEIMALEDDLGVRSAFYFLNEPDIFEESPLRDWLRPRRWIEHFGRYDVDSPEIVDVIRRLDEGGWEVGLHGSFDSFDDRERLRHEKDVLEGVLGHEITGGRQHWLNMTFPDTWEHHRAIGLDYDASLGSSSRYGFNYGYDPIQPFGDEFVVFPLTIMEIALEAGTASVEEAWEECERLLAEAAENDAVMTILWHPRFFNETEFPGHRELYRRIIERALEMDAWVGPPGDLHERLDVESASRGLRAGRSDVRGDKRRITK